MSKPILSLIIILLSVVFGFWYAKPMYGQVQDHRMAITELDETIERAAKIETLISETEETLNTINSADRARFEVFLPDAMDDIRFANTLQHIGTERSLVFEDIKVEAPGSSNGSNETASSRGVAGTVKNTLSLDRTPQGLAGQSPASGAQTVATKYKTTKASFSVTTSYSTFRELLHDLEKSLGLINITTLSFAPIVDTTASGKKTGVPLYRYMVGIETYSLQ